MGCSLRQLGPKIGISTASLFGYRAGTMPITGKAWVKLEAAERAAGRGFDGDTAYPAARVCEGDPLPYGTPRRDRLERIEAMLEKIGRHLGVNFEDCE